MKKNKKNVKIYVFNNIKKYKIKYNNSNSNNNNKTKTN